MSISKASSKASTSSTKPSESAPRSSMNDDSGLMSFSSTSSCSLMMRLTSANTSRPSDIFCLQSPLPAEPVDCFSCEAVFHQVEPEGSHVHATVDAQCVSGDVASLFRGQKSNAGRDLVGSTRSPEWNALEHGG